MLEDIQKALPATPDKRRPMAKRILRQDKYSPAQQDAAIELVLRRAAALGAAWAT